MLRIYFIIFYIRERNKKDRLVIESMKKSHTRAHLKKYYSKINWILFRT